MARWKQYTGLNIDLQNATKAQLTKELRRVKGYAERRISNIERAGYKSHAIEILNEKLDVIKSEDAGIRSKISAYDKYLQSSFATIDAIEAEIEKYQELVDLDDNVTASEILERIENASESVSDLVDIIGSDIINKIYDITRDESGKRDKEKGKEITYKLADVYNRLGEELTVNDLEDIFGVVLR